MNEDRFCQICHGAMNEGGAIAHVSWCPVLTGEPVAGQINPQMQPFHQNVDSLQQMAGLIAPAQGPAQQPRNMLGSLSFVASQQAAQDGYEVAKIYKQARARILEELRTQMQVNHQLERENIELRIKFNELQGENAELKDRVDELKGAILTQPPPDEKPWVPPRTIDDDVPF